MTTTTPTRSRLLATAATALAVGLVLTSCSSNDNEDTPVTTPPATQAPDTSETVPQVGSGTDLADTSYVPLD